jgi:hypothetical protein
LSVASGVLVRGACPGGQGLAGRTVPGVVPCAEPGVVPCPLAGLVVDAPGVDGVGVLGVVEVLEAGPGVVLFGFVMVWHGPLGDGFPGVGVTLVPAGDPGVAPG